MPHPSDEARKPPRPRDPPAGVGEEEHQELLAEFLAECRENLDLLEEDLGALRRSPTDQEVLASAFRSLHNIKGASALLGLRKLESLAHEGEGVLERMREGRLDMGPAVAGALHAVADAARRIIASLEAGEGEGEDGHEWLVETMDRLVREGPGASGPRRPRTSLRGVARPRPRPAGEGAVRVRTALLDGLVGLAEELALSSRAALETAQSAGAAGLAGALRGLQAQVACVREEVLKARMESLCALLERFAGYAQELAAAAGKRARMEVEGGGLVLDRESVEGLRGPLTHLLRNAVDHGIETPSVRRSRGKPAQGRISIRAFLEGSHVVVEVADDGSGVDTEAVRGRAVEEGLVTREHASSMGEEDLLDILYLPGFSTVTEANRMSGRGVGMDVVRTTVEGMGGTVSVRTRPGHGTAVRMRVPLTFARMGVLLLEDGGRALAVQKDLVQEALEMQQAELRRRILAAGGPLLFRVRGELWPCMDLRGMPVETLPEDPAAPADPAAVATVVLAGLQDRRAALLAGRASGPLEAVVRPMPPLAGGPAPFVGSAFLDDGSLAPLLDLDRALASWGAGRQQAPAP